MSEKDVPEKVICGVVDKQHAYRQIVNSHIFIDQFINFQYICRCCTCFNNRPNFVWVLTCQLMDMLSLFIVQHMKSLQMHWKILNWATKYAEGLPINVYCFIFTRVCCVLWVCNCTYAWQMQIKIFLIFLMASWLLTCYEKMISWVHKAFLAYWQLLEYIWECCLRNLMSQSGNCGMKQPYKAALCQIKLQGPYSREIQHFMAVLEWFWAR